MKHISSDKIIIDDKELEIKDRFTLILGKFKKESINKIQAENIFETLHDFSIIPIEDILTIFENQGGEFKNIKNSLKVLEFLNQSRDITNNNLKILNRYTEEIQQFTLILQYHTLLKKKISLEREKKFSSYKGTTSELTSKTDLLNKLNESVSTNKKKIKFLEQDYFNAKNQRDQINSTITLYNTQINDFTIQKKEIFSQINKITREIDDPISKKIVLDKNPSVGENQENLTKTKRIQNLQKQAGNIQREINQLTSKINDSKLKYDDLDPIFVKLESDYQNLLNIINNDEDRVKKISEDLKSNLIQKDESFKDTELSDLTIIKPVNQIEDEMLALNLELERLKSSINSLNKEKNESLSNSLKGFSDISESIKNEHPKFSIEQNDEDIKGFVNQFRMLDTLVNTFEKLLNEFLTTIYMESKIFISISEDYNKLFLQINYFRSIKSSDTLTFNDLTTPEKIFVVFTIFISINILLNKRYIVFSNLFLPSQFNKRGSIFRTIRKILPVFQNNNNLKKKNLVFVISNLELKKPLESLNTINI